MIGISVCLLFCCLQVGLIALHSIPRFTMSDKELIEWNEKISILVAMGASEEQAMELLEANGDNVENAIAKLEPKHNKSATVESCNESVATNKSILCGEIASDDDAIITDQKSVGVGVEAVSEAALEHTPTEPPIMESEKKIMDNDAKAKPKIATEEHTLSASDSISTRPDISSLHSPRMTHDEHSASEMASSPDLDTPPIEPGNTDADSVLDNDGTAISASISGNTDEIASNVSESGNATETPQPIQTEQATATAENVSNQRPQNDNGTNSAAPRRPMAPLSRPTVPGAVRVEGPDPTGAYDDYTLTPSTVVQEIVDIPDNSTVAVSAHLVHDNEEEYDIIQQQLRRREQELERIRRSRANVPVAEAVDENESEEELQMQKRRRSRRFRWAIVLIVVLLVVAITLGIVLPRNSQQTPGPDETATPAPTPPPSLVDMLSAVSLDGGEALNAPSTPQNDAMNWLAGNANLDMYSDEQKIQRFVLASIYYSTKGDSWTNNTGWLNDSNECSWYNNADESFCSNGRVVELELSENNLDGAIPADVALLSDSLVELNLFSNPLTGTIPSEISLLTGLNRLYLFGTKLTGVIPSELAELTGLNALQLNSNGLSSTIPTEMFHLTDLNVLALDNNTLTGSIPSEVGQLRNLTILYLSINELTGEIPSEIGLVTHLSDLSLIRNDLAGTIPTEIAMLTALGSLGLGGNFLNGNFISEIGLMTSLTGLFLWENQLTGSIPSEIGHLNRLTAIELQFNSFTGTIPTEFGLLTDLVHLRLDVNQFTGNYSCASSVDLCLISCTDTSNEACRSL